MFSWVTGATSEVTTSPLLKFGRLLSKATLRAEIRSAALCCLHATFILLENIALLRTEKEKQKPTLAMFACAVTESETKNHEELKSHKRSCSVSCFDVYIIKTAFEEGMPYVCEQTHPFQHFSARFIRDFINRV